jgi:Flp pilus assembly protein protease CpaA
MTAPTSELNDPDTLGPDAIDVPDASASTGASGTAGQPLALAVILAAAIGGFLLWADQRAQEPLAGFWLVWPFLVVIAQQDIQRRRIPNWATGTGLLLALGYHGVQAGLAGLLLAVVGAGLPLLLLFAAYAARIVGAGDIKALMVLGAAWGPSAVFSIIFWTLLLTGGLAIIVLTIRDDLAPWFRRWGRMLEGALRGRGLHYIAPQAGDAATLALPIGAMVALAAGTHLLWGGLWQ